jgi:(1->4)-alpha-D-glucan 1-alpha-D-glucosylmutase
MRLVPTATYRVQLNHEFGFVQARAIVPYLAALGISHVYASPYLKARKGSLHGYDIVDHNALNPELGTREDFNALIDSLHAHGMGHILDLVPNHMGVGGDDNAWWLDVLESGPASPYADHFDIDWHPAKDELRGKVMLPFLGDHYGTVLEHGELALQFDSSRGEFSVYYHAHRFPIDPSTYPCLLERRLDELPGVVAAQVQAVIEDFQRLPPRGDTRPDARRRRARNAPIAKRRLSDLCREQPAIAAFVHANVGHFNGEPGRPESFDPLHRLLEEQAYRIAYWKVASDEINYRRFFDINELAGLQMENPQVFDATHRLVLELVAAGRLEGVRIDHPDGLYDPLGYYRRLDRSLRLARGQNQPAPYVVVEKILASYERLPRDWPVCGTTGYDFAHVCNGVLVCPAGERLLNRLYRRYADREMDFDALVYRSKKQTVRAQLSSELTVLTNLLDKLAEADRRTRDFTRNGLRDALTELVACFPVYRTYVTATATSEEDRQFLQWAVAQAKKRWPAADTSVFDFIHGVLTLDDRDALEPDELRRRARFVMRFQQYTSPVMAKAVEDTVYYNYHRLVSLNEVGGDPRTFGISIAAFHRANQDRLQHWPAALLSTSTHDSKRSEDVRARIDVLSEIPDEWRRHLARWARLNRSRKRRLDGYWAPSRNDEYLLYQTLLGAWPVDDMDDTALAAFRERMEGYMLKACKEAKRHTSWINPNQEYEEAMLHFVRTLLTRPNADRFLDDFGPFARHVAGFGQLNSLTQTLLKLTAPGVPDIYQGNERWALELVDPDNRRPVDYTALAAALAALPASDELHPAEAADLMSHSLHDGRAKLYLTRTVLQLRRRAPALFQEGDYVPLDVRGPRAEHLIAFVRRHRNETVLVCAPRWFARLEADAGPVSASTTWRDTRIDLPGTAGTGTFRNLLTGQALSPSVDEDGASIAVAELFGRFPVALCLAEDVA